MQRQNCAPHTPNLVQKAINWTADLAEQIVELLPHQQSDEPEVIQAKTGDKLIARAHTKVNAESGSKVVAEEGANVVALRGANVFFKSGSFGIVEKGTQYTAYAGAFVMETADITPYLFRCATDKLQCREAIMPVSSLKRQT